MKIRIQLGSLLLCICTILAPGLLAQGPGSGSGSGGGPGAGSCSLATQQVSLHIPNESVPPGGIVQMKVMVTTPTPISSGGPRVKSPGNVQGIQLLNPSGDVNGVAMINGSQVSIEYITSTGAQGSDYPIMTMSIEVPSGISPGTILPFSLDPTSTWNLGFLGIATLKAMAPSTITVGGSISIMNIVPGGGLLPAGTVVSVEGLGFQPLTQVQLSGFSASSISVVSANEIQIVLAQPTEMSGKKIQVTNPDGSQATYFSYVRGIPLVQSNRALLSSAIPIFSSVTHSTAVFASAVSAKNQFSGVAVQNSNLTAANVTFTLSSADGTLGTSTISIPSGYRLMEETSELAQGVAPPPGSSLTVSSDIPIQVFGFQGDDSAGTVLPFTPLSSQP